jgi:hypothetical protein
MGIVVVSARLYTFGAGSTAALKTIERDGTRGPIVFGTC